MEQHKKIFKIGYINGIIIFIFCLALFIPMFFLIIIKLIFAIIASNILVDEIIKSISLILIIIIAFAQGIYHFIKYTLNYISYNFDEKRLYLYRNNNLYYSIDLKEIKIKKTQFSKISLLYFTVDDKTFKFKIDSKNESIIKKF